MTIDELIQQKAAIDEQIAELRKSQRAKAISDALTLIKQYDLTEHDLFEQKVRAKVGKVLPPKYRHPVTGQTWSGKGRAPKWMNGGDRSAFVIS
jgi:DNA-binding protein H-NS